VETGIPFFRGLEISKLGSSSKLEDLLYISEEYYKNLKDKYGVPQIGDILITAVGTLGNSYLIRNNTPFYFKDGNLIWLSDIKINSQYLNTYLGNGIGKKRVLESAAGSNQKALTMVKLQNVQVLFPSKEEQRKIEIFFQNLDNLITLHQRKLFLIMVPS
jgi:type I restriction enzyme S subunit